jgi:hypothetical protein
MQTPPHSLRGASNCSHSTDRRTRSDALGLAATRVRTASASPATHSAGVGRRARFLFELIEAHFFAQGRMFHRVRFAGEHAHSLEGPAPVVSDSYVQ